MSLSRAIETGDLAQLPGRRDEDWRWSDLRGALRVLPPPTPPGEAARLGSGPFDALADAVMVILNGRALFADPVVIRGSEDRTLALRVVSQDAGAHRAQLRIRLEPGARLTLLESHEALAPSAPDGACVSHLGLEITLGSGAVMERVVLAADGPAAVSVKDAAVTLAPGADYAQCVLTDGAQRQRIETRVDHPGGGGTLRLDGVYLLDDVRHADLTSVVAHQGLDGQTRQLTKGAVAGRARGVFQGRILVQPGADRTDARMGHHALILSDRGEVDAKPELLIFADDVQCAHGNTVGALDEDALFYTLQRGVPLAEAKAMLTLAFVGEVIDRIGHPGAQAIARAWAEARLEAMA